MKKILPFLALLLVGCSSFDEVSIQESPILASATTEEMTTRATLINDTGTLAEVFPTMTIQTGSTKLDVATTELVKGNYNTGWYWGNSAKTFVSYPKGVINPTIGDNQMTFEYAPSTSMDDIVVAVDTKNNAPLQFDYLHIFCTVNVIYKSLQIAHKITNVTVSGDVQGKCVVTPSSVTWSATTSGEIHNYQDNTPRQAYHENQDLGIEKFMFVPIGKPKVYVTIDGTTISHVVTCVPEPGKIINVYINDDLSFKEDAHAPVDKKVSKNSDGTYNLTLESYVTGKVVSSTETKPTNTVMLLDISTTMLKPYGTAIKTNVYQTNLSYYLKGLDTSKPMGYYCTNPANVIYSLIYKKNEWQFVKYADQLKKANQVTSTFQASTFNVYVSRLGALYDAAMSYVDGLKNSGGNHTITLITFGYDGYLYKSNLNVQKDYSTIKEALVDYYFSQDNTGGKKIHLETASDKAFALVKRCLSETSLNEVIFITDGNPNNGSPESNKSTYGEDFEIATANRTVSYANELKALGATVYSVGVYDSGIKDAGISFLNRVSSNYSGATTYNNGTKVSDKYYAMGQSNSAVTTILNSIVQEVITSVPSLDLGVNSYVTDIISDAFAVPTSSNIVIRQKVNGGSETAITDMNVTYTLSGRTLTVKGFDYAKYPVTSSTAGRKLIIHINNLKLIDSTTTKIYTNVYSSGLYAADGTLVSEFECPTIN